MLPIGVRQQAAYQRRRPDSLSDMQRTCSCPRVIRRYRGLVATTSVPACSFRIRSGSPVELDQAFGPARVAVNTASARGTVHATPWPMLGAVFKIARNVAGSRLSGKYRDNPFFKAGTAEPVVAPQVLTSAERHALRGDTQDGRAH